MKDGLYIDDVWVSPADELRLTLEVNDLQEPAYLQTSYSRDFTLPDTLTVRRVTEGAEATNSDSRIPFTLLPAYVVQSDSIVFDGYVRFGYYSGTGGWRVSLLDHTRAIYARLDRSLRTLNLSRWSFRWNTDAVIAAAANTEGYCFPLVDYGAIENGGQAADLLLPAVFVKTLLTTMLGEEGYRLDWPTDQRYVDALNALTLPMDKARPTISVGETFVADRQARAGIEFAPGLFAVSRNRDFSVTVPFNVIDRPSQGFSQGRLGNYRADLFGYVADTSMRLAINLNLSYRIRIIKGGVRLTLQLLKNGAVIKNEDYEEGGPHNVFLTNYQSFTWAETIDVAPGDRITIQLIGHQFTWLGDWEFYLDDERSSVTFAPDTAVRYGDNYPLAANLPDMTCLEVLKSAALACCGTYLADEAEKVLRFVPLTPLVANRTEVADWSSRIDERGAATYRPSIEPYAQKNILAYKQTGNDETQGNGLITINASALDDEQTLFTLPFGPVASSNRAVGVIDVLPRIELRTIERQLNGTNTITDKDSGNGPHWLLVHPTMTQELKTLVTVAGVNQEVTVSLRVAWFDSRPLVVRQADTLNLNLSFNDPTRGEAGLISTFFGGLAQVLERPRTVELMRVFTPSEIASIRLDRQVYIEAASIGGLSMPGTYYYISQIDGYAPDVLCKVTLIITS